MQHAQQDAQEAGLCVVPGFSIRIVSLSFDNTLSKGRL